MIQNLEVSRYRSISSLKAGPFGRVNLITGKNNVGKSSVLEAIRLLVTECDSSVLASIVDYREEGADSESIEDAPDKFPYSGLFFGFPEATDGESMFQISASRKSDHTLLSVSVSVGMYRREIDEDKTVRLVKQTGTLPLPLDFYDDAKLTPVLEIKTPNNIFRLPTNRIRRKSDASGLPTNKCAFVDPFSSRPTGKLASLWDNIALKEPEKRVIESLRLFADEIEDVTWIASEKYREPYGGSRFSPRMAIAKSKSQKKPVALRSFGDGLNRWLGILLNLANVPKGYLLIDEVETGIHYSVQVPVWRAIFKLATDLDVQVFATTHSWDCITAFQSAAADSEEEGVLFRLNKRGEAHTVTRFSEEELRIVTRDQIEVR